MLSDWKVRDLITLIRQRYPEWEDFDHPGFVADEIEIKQATVTKAHQLLSQGELNRLITAGDYEAFLDRLEKVSRDNNLLWRRVPSSGDTAVLYQAGLDKAAFCTQMRNLIYGDRPSPQRLQTFADYAAANDLPNKWPFPTYFLFICHPQREMFVKPRTAEWFLKYMGVFEEDSVTTVTAPPEVSLYATILEHSWALYEALQPYGARDMVDVQSFVWICSQESKKRTGRLDVRGQVELDVPATKPVFPTAYQIGQQTAVMYESEGNASYRTEETPYPLVQWAAETGFDEGELARWVRAIERKGQVILYGPPGTGKTFMAEGLARHLASEGDGFWELVQFHPAYAYEDFVQGIRPITQAGSTLRYELVPGRFLQFCARAQDRRGPCLLIIDEINRANLSSVFGELMYLLEYRQREIPLAAGSTFRIPRNVRLIGTMNTADRSIALVDHALRRRFAFIPLAPNYQVLGHYHAQTGFPVEGLVKLLQQLNNRIGDPHYHVGHTFFLHPDLETQIRDIWHMEIEPYLEEYFFDQPDQVDAFRWQQVEKKVLP
jgi:hypothetical protein